jgi:hypothetical protein
MKFNIKREYTEEVDLELPVCFVEEKEYFKTVYLLTNIDNNKFEGINVNFFREEKKSNWYFTGIRKGMIFEDEVKKFINGQEGFAEQNTNYFRLTMKEVAKGMEGIADELKTILK